MQSHAGNKCCDITGISIGYDPLPMYWKGSSWHLPNFEKLQRVLSKLMSNIPLLHDSALLLQSCEGLRFHSSSARATSPRHFEKQEIKKGRKHRLLSLEELFGYLFQLLEFRIVLRLISGLVSCKLPRIQNIFYESEQTRFRMQFRRSGAVIITILARLL